MNYGIYLYRRTADGYAAADQFSETDLRAVEEVLRRWGWDGVEVHPAPDLRTPGGERVEVRGDLAAGRFCGLYLNVWNLDLEICQLALEIAQAGRFTIIHDGDDQTPILIDEAQRENLPAEWTTNPAVVVVTTPQELEDALGKGFGQWIGWKASLKPYRET